MSTMKFDELNLSNDTLKALKNSNLNEVTSLQQSIITHTIDGESLLVKAGEDDDKNTAIAIAALETVHAAESTDVSRVLILTVSAETARSINEQIQAVSTSGDVSMCIDNEGDRDAQAEAIAGQVPIMVANPDRLQELLQEHRFIFRNLDLLVLDQMDNMVANDSTSSDLKQIKRRVLSDYTTLICSETLNKAVKKASESFADEPAVIGFESGTDTPPPVRGNLSQRYIKVPNRMKISTLMAHIGETSGNNCVIFTASKRGTDRLYRVLKKRSLKATSLHAKLSDEKRAQRFANFTNSDVQYLLVSDISAADLDLNGVVQVINYDVPNSPDEYRFRAALVGEGKNAQIVSLVSKQDQNDISQLQNELGQTPEEIPLPDEVKQKLKQRKNKQNQSGNGRKKKSRGNRQKKTRERPKKDNEMQLPQPSYDKLSGGRSGNHNEKETGIVKFFKKLFS